jgi:folate-binding protein YgfZ
LLNAQGKILFHVLVVCTDDALMLDTVPGEGERLLAHLDRYLIREQVQLEDRSGQRGQYLLSGAGMGDCLNRMGVTPPPGRLDHRLAMVANAQVRLVRVDMTNADAVLVDLPIAHSDAVRQAIVDAGARPCIHEGFEAARIEAGFPWFGRDISHDNLPQEVARDERAISFVKGCYIGQETVARIDALGHVNKALTGLALGDAAIPADGSDLTASDGKVVGQITSAAYSPRLSAAVALGYVRRGSGEHGATLRCSSGAAVVTRLPMV